MDTDQEGGPAQALRDSLARKPTTVESLGRLVAELESLGAIMEGVDDRWRASFNREWSAIEEVYAVALDREQDVLDEDDQAIIAEATRALQVLAGKL